MVVRGNKLEIINHSSLFKNTLTQLNVQAHIEVNTFTAPYNSSLGWPLKLPEIDWQSTQMLLLHFQDFVTFQNEQIVELDRVAEHYGKHANRILVTHMHPGLEKVYSGPINLIEFSSHNYRETQIMRHRWSEWQHIAEHAKTQPWQCLNGRKCPHRRWTVNILSEWGDGIISYGPDIPLPEWHISQLKGRENCDNFIGLGGVYSRCAVNIVTETLYDPVPGLFSEKTLHALFAQQIPIVIGSQGLVSSIRAHGFDMFDDVVDTSYDSLPNETRIPQALALNRDLIQGRIDLAPYQERLRAQREFVLHAYPKLMELKFVRDCKRLISKLDF
jgi:hypothetical protein